jgi:hypothetical protein
MSVKHTAILLDPQYVDGAYCYRIAIQSKWFGYLYDVPGDIAMKVFWPPLYQANLQIQTPADPIRANWIADWNAEQRRVLQDLEHE